MTYAQWFDIFTSKVRTKQFSVGSFQSAVSSQQFSGYIAESLFRYDHSPTPTHSSFFIYPVAERSRSIILHSSFFILHFSFTRLLSVAEASFFILL
jgi:hypothetical protein